MKNKKGVEIQFIILLIIGLIVLVILVVIIPKLLGKGSAEAKVSLSQTEDYDGDTVVDYYDKCKCMSGDRENGCPESEYAPSVTPNPDGQGYCQYKTCPVDRVPEWAKKTGCP